MIPGTSCLATIVLSLRDKSHSPIEAPHNYLSACGVQPWEPSSQAIRPEDIGSGHQGASGQYRRTGHLDTKGPRRLGDMPQKRAAFLTQWTADCALSVEVVKEEPLWSRKGLRPLLSGKPDEILRQGLRSPCSITS
jgi:hypothetical protein